jgi:hypothetical protein
MVASDGPMTGPEAGKAGGGVAPSAMEPSMGKNSSLVVDLAMPYRDTLPRGLSWQDFLQEGEVGLAQAVRKFDPTRGVDFRDYARPWIVGCFRAIIAATTLNPLGRSEESRDLTAKPPGTIPGEISGDVRQPPGVTKASLDAMKALAMGEAA